MWSIVGGCRGDDSVRTFRSFLQPVPDADDAVSEPGLGGFELLEGGREVV